MVSLRNLMDGALSGFRGWFAGRSCSRTKKVDALFDKAVAETEAVSQEAKALRRDVERLCRNPDAFENLISDMRRVREASH